MPHNESKKAPRYGSAGRPSKQSANTARNPGANSQIDMSGKLPEMSGHRTPKRRSGN